MTSGPPVSASRAVSDSASLRASVAVFAASSSNLVTSRFMCGRV